MTKREYNQKYYASNRERLRLQAKDYRIQNREKIILSDRERYPRRRTAILARLKNNYVANGEKIRAKNRAYYHANKEVFAAKSKIWRQENIKTILQKNYAYVKANRSKANQWRRNWKAKNPGKFTAYDAERRALELKAKTDKKLVDEFYRWVRSQPFVPCTYCGGHLHGKQIEVDHIVPLSRGGDHLPSNFCVSCRSCNASKGDKLLSEWLNRPQLNVTNN